MNWQNKEGDIKKILENQEFAFNPGDWEVAEKMLLLRKKRRKRKRLLIILPLPVVLLLALGIYTAREPGREIALTEINTPEKTIEINNSKENRENTTGKTAAENPHQEAADATVAVSPDGNKNVVADKQAVFNNEVEKSINLNSGSNKNITGEENGPVIIPGKKEEIKENNIPSAKEEKESGDSNELPAVAGPAEIPPAAALADTAETPSANAEPGQEEEQKQAKKEKDEETEAPAARHKIGITAGGNYSRLLSAQRGRFALLPYVAVNYGYVFNTKWQVGTGLAYSVNNGGLQKQYRVKQHGFGETSTELTIQTTRLHYLEIPVTARYNFNDKLFFTGGINAGYLFDITGNVDETSTGPFVKSAGYSKKTSDYRAGLKPWDIQLQLGAEVRYKKQFYMGGLISSGLLDIGNNGYYNNAAFERNLRLQLYVRYELWNF